MKLTLRNFGIVTFIWVGLFCFNLAFAQKTELYVQIGHQDGLTAVSFSPDGSYLVTGSYDGTAKLWDVSTGAEMRTFSGHSSGVTAVSFSPDSSYIVTGSYDGTAKLWDVTTGTEIRTFSGHSDCVYGVSFSPDGINIVTGSADSTAKLWDITTGSEIRTFSGHSGCVYGVSFSPDGINIVTGSADSTAKLWDITTGIEIRTFRGHSWTVGSVSFSPDGSNIVTGSPDKTVRLWNVKTGAEIRTFNGEDVGVFSPDGSYIVTGECYHGTLKLWDVATGARIRTFIEHSDCITVVSFSPDGRYIVAGNFEGTAKLWDVDTGSEIRTFSKQPNPGSHATFSPDGSYIVIWGGVTSVKLWDATTGAKIRTLDDSERTNALVFSTNSSYIATGRFSDGIAELWDVATGARIRTFSEHSDKIRALSFSPNDSFIVTGGVDNRVKLWDVTTGEEIRTFNGGYPIAVNSVSFSIDGSYIVTGGGVWYSSISLWDVNTGENIRALDDSSYGVNALDFSPDGSFIVTGSKDGTAKLWDITTGAEIRTFSGHSGNIETVGFSPDGSFIVSGSMDRTAKLWDIVTGAEIRTFRGHSGTVTTVSFNPNGSYLITGSWDCATKLWNVKTGTELATLISIGEDDWAVTTPDGLFDASEGALEQIHFVRGLEVIELNQLKERYYEPGLLAKIMGFNDDPLLNVKALSEAKLYPEIELNDPTPDNSKLKIHLKNRGGGIGKVIVFINDKEITADAREANADPNADEMELAVDIGDHPYLIPGKDNIIEVKAFNADGYLASRNVRVIYKAPAKDKVEPPTLWGIVAGVSDYHGNEIDLRFAAKDAVDMAQALNIGAHRLFGAERTYITLLTTEKAENAIYPDKDNLFQAFSDVAAKAKSTDILVVYLAGHGVTYGGQDGDYYYLTAEASSGNLKDEAIRQQRAVSSQELTEQIKKIPALKQVLILDTCHSGRFSEDMTKDRAISSSQIRAYERMKDRTGLHILAGAAADAVAYESSSYGQGILTYSLLLGMRGAALKDGEFIDIGRLFEYSAEQVPQLAKGIGGIQRPILAMPYGGASFDVGRLTKEDKEQIPLANPRPLVLRSNFQDEDRFIDHLGLTKIVNDSLREVSFRGRDATLIFVDAVEFPGAYSLAGRYRTTNGKLNVSVRIFKGEEKIGEFRVDGDRNALHQLIADLLQNAEGQISVPKH